MRGLRRIALAVALACVALAAIAVASALLSLDWKRRHTSESAALPVFSGFGGPSLVRIPARGMEFRARVAGERGPGAILLHGFPVTSAMYEPLLRAAAAAGYRAVAFDQRGYSPGARPAGTQSYVASELVADVLAVADAVGFERFHLVGHDWGAVVGWGLAARSPERVRTWTALSIPHPTAFSEALRSDPDQQRRSRYFALLTTPWLPEILLRLNGLALLRRAYAPMSPAQRAEYLRVFAEPGALRAALAWYRAIARSQAEAADLPQITPPTLFIWGNRDPAVGRFAVRRQRDFITGPYREVELDAEHWLLEPHAERIVDEVLAHWRAADAGGPRPARKPPADPGI